MSLSYCEETVRKHDPDRFLLSMFAPPAKRAALWALYAFNHEIARTREVVTDTHLGLIRLQWWRDTLGAVYEGKAALSDHPVLPTLAQAIADHALPRDAFDNLVYAREFDLEDRQPASLEGLVKYAGFTTTPLTDLSLRVLGEEGQETSSIENISAAYAMTGMLRALPFHLRQRRCYLPADMVPFADDLYDGKKTDLLPPVVQTVVEKAQSMLDARRGCKSRFLKLHASLARQYLRQIAQLKFDVLSPRMAVPPLGKELRILLSAYL